MRYGKNILTNDLGNLRSLLYLVAALGVLFVALGESLPSHCSTECEDDCHEACDCINCLQHQVLVADLVPQFDSTHGDELHLLPVEQALLPQVSDHGIDHPPQNLA